MNGKRKLLCVSTTKPATGITAGGVGGSLVMICPKTGSLPSSLRVTGDLAGKVPVGTSTLSLFPASFATSNSRLAIGFGATANKKDDSYALLFTLRSASLPPVMHWKCRLPEAQMTAGLVVSPDGHYIVGGSVTGTIYVWSSIGGALLKSVKAHYRSVAVLSWSDCGRHLITGGTDGMVHVFSLLDLVEVEGRSSVQPIRTWTKHHLAVTAIVPMEGGRFATASQDGQIALFEICSGTALASIQLPQPVVSLTEHSNRLFAGSSNGLIHIVDLDDYAMHRTTQLGATVIRRNDSEKSAHQIVFGGSDKGGAGETPYLVELHGHSRAVTALKVVSDEVSSDDLLISGDESGTLRVWDLSSRSCVRVVQPWSHTGSKPATLAANVHHPVTSINIVEESFDSNSSGIGMFGGGPGPAGRNSQNRNKPSSLVTSLQRFVNQDQATAPAPVPFPRPTRSLHNNVWDVAATNTSFSFAVALDTKRRRTGQSGPPEKKRQLIVDRPSANEAAEMKKLQKELEEAKATIQRWETVNNKLMERLQQRS